MTHTLNGGEIHRTPTGRAGTVRAHGVEIHYGPGGSRTFQKARPDGSFLESNKYGHGYIQRSFNYRGAPFLQRTYYVNGVTYSRIYRRYAIRGVRISVYTPVHYFPAPFYSWAFYPFNAPFAYNWGWMADPWYGYYGGYFTPYAVYPSPSLWLTDYLMAQTLQASYLERVAELANAPNNSIPLSPAVKQQIADEVNRQIMLESREAAAGTQTAPDPGSSGIERMLGDGRDHVFLVSSPLTVQSTSGECAINEGDVLGLTAGASPDLSALNLTVLARSPDSCPRNSVIVLAAADLQEMQNHMRETIDQGLSELQQQQGRNGIPAAPSEALQPPRETGFAAIAPPPDPTAPSQLTDLADEADRTQKEVLGRDAAERANREPSDRSRAWPRLAVGQSPSEVVAIIGESPLDKYDTGSTQVYIFSDVTVTFSGGKLVKIQE